MEAAKHQLGNFRLESGALLNNAFLAYETHGNLASDKSNVIVYPHGTRGITKIYALPLVLDDPWIPINTLSSFLICLGMVIRLHQAIPILRTTE